MLCDLGRRSFDCMNQYESSQMSCVSSELWISLKCCPIFTYFFFFCSVCANSGRKYKFNLRLVNFKPDGFDFFGRQTSPLLTECCISIKEVFMQLPFIPSWLLLKVVLWLSLGVLHGSGLSNVWQGREQEWPMDDPKRENKENRICDMYNSCLFSIAADRKECNRYFSNRNNLLLSNEE